jgi:ABC-type Fe3+ transport system permease subunit
LTAVVALIPLALSDPFWESLSVTLIFGLLSSTLLVILCFPYYLIAAEVLRSGGRKVSKKLHFKKNRKTA